MKSVSEESRLLAMRESDAVEIPGRQRWPGDLLLQPVSIAALILVIINDRWLKVDHPGLVSGKISDFAGLIYFPLLLVSLLEAARFVVRRRTWELTPRAVLIASSIVGIAFVLIKTWAPASEIYREVMGYFFWPGFAFIDFVKGNQINGVREAFLAQDPWDLLGLIVLPIPVLVARKVMRTSANASSATTRLRATE